VPHASTERESRKRRLLRLMLLQIAILSIANGCTGSRQEALRDEQPAQPAPRHRYVEARFVPTDLTESLDRMADRGTDPRRAIFPVELGGPQSPGGSEKIRQIGAASGISSDEFIEHTATSRLDTGRLVIETEP
jgi:hypothetical protein